MKLPTQKTVNSCATDNGPQTLKKVIFQGTYPKGANITHWVVLEDETRVFVKNDFIGQFFQEPEDRLIKFLYKDDTEGEGYPISLFKGIEVFYQLCNLDNKLEIDIAILLRMLTEIGMTDLPDGF